MTYAEHLGRRLGERRAEAALGLLGLLGLLGALALGLLPLPVAAALLGALVVVTFSFFDPLWGLYALVLSVPIQELVLLPNGQTITQVCALLALLGLLLRTLQRRERRLPREMLLPWLFFLLSLLLAAAFASYSEGEATKMLGRWGAAFLAFELTLAAVTTRARAWGLIGCLLLAPLATALLGLWQFATATGPESFQVGRFVRAYGTLGKPNPLAGYLNMAWPLAATLALALLARMARGWRNRGMGRGEHAGGGTTKTRRINSKHPALASEQATGAEVRAGAGMPELRLLGMLLCAGVALTLVAGLGATYSRGGWLGAAAGAMLMVAFAGRKAALLDAALVGALALVLLGGGSLLPASVSGRLSSITANLRIFDAARANVDDDNFAVVERMAHWQAGARMFAANPVLGVGPGNFNLAYRDYFVGRWYQSQGHAHNYYIHIAAEAGLPGLLAYLLLILSASRAALRAVTVSAGTIWRAVAIGGCGIIAAVAAHQVFENLHVLNLGVQLSAVWGLMVVIVRLAQEKDRQPYAQALCH